MKWMKELHPEASQRRLAILADTSRGVVQRTLEKLKQGRPIDNAFRSGRAKKLDADGMRKLKEAATSSLSSSSASVCRDLQARHGLTLAPRTARKYLKEQGLKYGSPKIIPCLNDKQKKNRVAFASRHIAKPTDFRGIMFTDSKIFCLSKEGLKSWYVEGAQPQVPQNKYCLKCHVYLGVTNYGPTDPIFVTSSSQKSSFSNAKGQAQKGVGSEEYNEHVLPHLITNGDRLFKGTRFASSWILQQDNAPCHTAKINKSFLDIFMPGRWINDWPACSPDLSWIENVWSWADKQLNAVRTEISNSENPLQSFTDEITRVLTELPVQHCENYVRGMLKRMNKVIQLGGENIGM